AVAARPPRRRRGTAPAAAPGPARPVPGRLLPWALVIIVAGGVAAALGLGLVPLERWLPTGEVDDPTTVAIEARPAAAPAGQEVSALDPAPEDRRAQSAARSLGEVVHELDAAESALGEEDLDGALRHFAAAAAIDRHHRGVVSLAESLIAALLRDADRAFDDTDWELAGKRVDDARHLARGLYLDTAVIEQTARRHELMTRFVDLRVTDPAPIRSAVGRAVRVTLTTRDRLLGRLEAVRDGRLVLAIHSGLEGGGVRFSKEIPLEEVAEVRVYDAAHPSRVVLDPRSPSP
ncbi:MAG TPA: hypothetical protein VLB51_12875, partial [Methylomirabilota bacterium]|nr:hypothetical protein [Methylomirabilota bacterium]